MQKRDVGVHMGKLCRLFGDAIYQLITYYSHVFWLHIRRVCLIR